MSIICTSASSYITVNEDLFFLIGSLNCVTVLGGSCEVHFNFFNILDSTLKYIRFICLGQVSLIRNPFYCEDELVNYIQFEQHYYKESRI